LTLTSVPSLPKKEEGLHLPYLPAGDCVAMEERGKWAASEVLELRIVGSFGNEAFLL